MDFFHNRQLKSCKPLIFLMISRLSSVYFSSFVGSPILCHTFTSTLYFYVLIFYIFIVILNFHLGSKINFFTRFCNRWNRENIFFGHTKILKYFFFHTFGALELSCRDEAKQKKNHSFDVFFYQFIPPFNTKPYRTAVETLPKPFFFIAFHIKQKPSRFSVVSEVDPLAGSSGSSSCLHSGVRRTGVCSGTCWEKCISRRSCRRGCRRLQRGTKAASERRRDLRQRRCGADRLTRVAGAAQPAVRTAADSWGHADPPVPAALRTNG